MRPMNLNVCRLDERKRQGIMELKRDFNISLSDKGIGLAAKQGVCLEIKENNGIVEIVYSRESEFYRALLLLAEKGTAGLPYRESRYFANLSFLADCSRNAVINTDTIKRLIRMLAVCGYDTLHLYTEDTYEIESEPYFGYLRGRYTKQELKQLDTYAALFGIELAPCIQTLAHLQGVLRWNTFAPVWDCKDILMAETAETYALIEKMFAAAADCFRSRNIIIGMDEATMLGRGRYLDKYGYRDKKEILLDHLDTVVAIGARYGFSCAIFSDMLFEHYSIDKPNIVYAENLNKNVRLIFWDYYKKDKAYYDHYIRAHGAFSNELCFAGGAWKWTGFAPNNKHSLATAQAALSACRDNKVNRVMLAAWADNGAEASLFSILPSVVYYAETAVGNEEDWKRRFTTVTGCAAEHFLALDAPNEYCEDTFRTMDGNAGKAFFYNDPMSGIFDYYAETEYRPYFVSAAEKLKTAQLNLGRFAYIAETLRLLAETLILKFDFGRRLYTAYNNRDKARLLSLANETEEIVARTERFYEALRKQWLFENKPHGFEVQDIRIGGLIRRLQSCAASVKEYCAGKRSELLELERVLLPFDTRVNRGCAFRFNYWEHTFTVNNSKVLI